VRDPDVAYRIIDTEPAKSPGFSHKSTKTAPDRGAVRQGEDKSLMFQKSTNILIGWVVGGFRVNPFEPLHPPLVPVWQVPADAN
jgi:hypothetical protein